MSTVKQTSPYLTAHKLQMTHGANLLFDELSFAVHPGERWGIVGPNGAGKSTLLKCLTGETKPDAGTVSLRSGLRFAVVSQRYGFDISKTVRTILSEALPPEFQTQKKIEEVQQQIEQLSFDAEKNQDLYHSDSWLGSLSKLQDELEKYAGIGEENILQSVIQLGGLEEHEGKTIAELSGGLQKRVQILAALLGNPQLVFLDEPTNHLDVATVDWLEEFLLDIVEQGVGFLGFRNIASEPFSFVLVSHDRALLDTLVNRILEIEGGETRTYEGNFEAYSEQKLLIIEQNEKQRDRMANLYRRELAWLRRGPAARTTKQTARIERAQKLEGTLATKDAKVAIKGNSKIELTAELTSFKRNNEDALIEHTETLGEQQLLVLDAVTLAHPAYPDPLNADPLNADQSTQSHQSAQASQSARSQQFGRPSVICHGLNLVLKPRTRLALVGPNGCGKTTLLKAMRGEVLPIQGEVKRHELLNLAYFDQHRAELQQQETVLKTVCAEGEYVFFGRKYIHVMSYLERFLFRRSDCDREVSALSGGEQARLLLAKLMLQHGNLLVLDEPTNDLDIPTLQTLEANLQDFSGAVVFTSHDRYFISRVSTEVLNFQGYKEVTLSGGRKATCGIWESYPDLGQALSFWDLAKTKHGLAAGNASKAASAGKGGQGSAGADKSNKRDKQESIAQKKLSWSEEKELLTLEASIPKDEAALAALTAELDTAYQSSVPFGEVQALAAKVATLQEQLAKANQRWEELFEKKM